MKDMETLTGRLHSKADAALRTYLHEAINPIFEECRDIHYLDLAKKNPAEWGTNAKWIGEVTTELHKLAFLYLREKWRAKFVYDFMEKVELAASAIEELQSNQPQ